jgi:hypothetical protein
MHIDKPEPTVMYLGKSVPLKHFRAYVYGANDTMQLANSWPEYEKLIGSGKWFESKDLVAQKELQIPNKRVTKARTEFAAKLQEVQEAPDENVEY